MGRLNDVLQKKYHLLLEISLGCITILTMFGLYIFIANFTPVKLLFIPTIIILVIITLPSFLRGSILTIVITIIGIICVLGTFLLIWYGIDNNILSMRMISDSKKLFVIGMATLIISVIMIFKPEMLYAKNRPPEIKPKIWNSKDINRDLIPLKVLLSDEELYLLSNYRYVMASIDYVIYYVPINEYVPRDCIVLRKNGYFIGVRRN